MHRFISIIFFGFFVLLALSPEGRQSQSPARARQLYAYAEKLYNDPNPTDAKDSMALAAYLQSIAMMQAENIRDSILWDCYFKAAIFLQTKGEYEPALPMLRNCLKLKDSLPMIDEKSMYLPTLYTGNSYYFMNRYDSARYFYRKAEMLADRYPDLSGLERLYNTLGVLNFETGNYKQSRNYFEKAVNTLSGRPHVDTALLVNFKSNLASALRKLEAYDEALAIYNSLLGYHVNTDELYQNIATIFLNVGASPQAIRYLMKVKKEDINKLNNLGLAYLNKEAYDSAEYYLRKAVLKNQSEYGSRKNLYHGLSFRYLGDVMLGRQQFDSALQYYQRAMRQMIYTFDATDIHSYPGSYSGVFSVAELYETLLSKAKTFALRYNISRDTGDLKASLAAYTSLYQLSDYASKTYESDEARIYLSQKNYRNHQQPIQLCLVLYQLTGRPQYLEDAFFFDERNKASVLSANLQEFELKQTLQIPDSLLSAESNIRENISRLLLRVSQLTDSAAIRQLQDQEREYEIELDAIQRKFENYPDYERLKYFNYTISIKELQQSVIPENAAILSYHLSDSSLLIWAISRKAFHHYIVPISDSFRIHTRQLRELLEGTGGGTNREILAHARFLYNILIRPAENELTSVNQLMIIPDDELNFIPFEVLYNGNNQYLLSRFSILYNYSCTLLKEFASRKRNPFSYSLLAMAPYTNGISEEYEGARLLALPSSAAELSSMHGKVLIGKQAGKNVFVQEAPGFSILHLATHAKADDKDPMHSYIAFYPAHPDSPSVDKLFIPEIYQLGLRQTRLAILSACETGSGQLIRGEGIISFSRGFSYAGCPNTITSLWKADDKATSYISKQLHQYLESGETIARSLQLAKLDYLNDDEVAGRYKTAAYWATLRLAGSFESARGRCSWWLLMIVPLLLLAGYIALKKIRPSQKGADRISAS